MQTLGKWLKVSTKVFFHSSVTEYVLRNVKKHDKIECSPASASILGRTIDVY